MSGERNSAQVADQLIPPSPPPRPASGAIPWLRLNLFNGVAGCLQTLISIAVILLAVPPIFEWTVLHGV